MKSITVVTLPLLAGYLFAQDPSRIETGAATAKTTWNGTLVDAACQSTRTVTTESNPDRSVTTTTRTVECPVTATTSAFGLLTSDGRYIRFDNPSNMRVIEIVKGNQAMSSFASGRPPIRVSVIGAASGDVAVVESLNPETGSQTVYAEPAGEGQADVMFDVKYHDDRGKLIVTGKGVNFEDISDAKHSRGWSYSQIRELKRDGRRELKIEPYSGDSYEFRLEDRELSDAVYKTIADRIVAARTR